MGLKLIILLALLVGVLYCIHLLVRDYQSLTASRVLGALFRGKRDVLLHQMKPNVRWRKILQYDSVQCTRYLFCDLGVRPPDTEVRRGFVFMLAPTGARSAHAAPGCPWSPFKNLSAPAAVGSSTAVTASIGTCLERPMSSSGRRQVDNDESLKLSMAKYLLWLLLFEMWSIASSRELVTCAKRIYLARAEQTDLNDRKCWDTVKVPSCGGRCDSREIPDWQFPFKKSHHPVCGYTTRKPLMVRLRHCDPGVKPGTELFHFVGAEDCRCKVCSSHHTSCEWLPPNTTLLAENFAVDDYD